jgi:hypothetical protein
MTDMDFIMLYFVLSTVICGFLAAFAYACRLKYKDDRAMLAEARPWLLRTAPGGCRVCGINTTGGLCSECCTWAEIQSIRCENNMAFTSVQRDNEAEHRRLVKTTGW